MFNIMCCKRVRYLHNAVSSSYLKYYNTIKQHSFLQLAFFLLNKNLVNVVNVKATLKASYYVHRRCLLSKVQLEQNDH